MKKLIPCCFVLIVSNCFTQTTRNYFFNDLIISDSTALILIVQSPQTEFARKLNHRIYTDTSFIRKLKESWYKDVPAGPGASNHRCDYDMYFYQSSGQKLTSIGYFNSQCDPDQIHSGDLSMLEQSGKALHVDTLNRIPNFIDKQTLFNEHFVQSYRTTLFWEYGTTNNYPEIYYDGYFIKKIQLDSSFTIRQNIENFVLKYVPDLEGINWYLPKESMPSDYRWKVKDFDQKRIPMEVDVKFYLKSDKISLFKKFMVTPIPFRMKRGEELILIYDD